MKNNLWNKIFHSKELNKQIAEEKELAHKKANENKYLNMLSKCTKISDLLKLHKILDQDNYEVNILLENQHDNYTTVPVQEAAVEHYYCSTYDGDGTYHGWNMLEMEKNHYDDDWNYFSYCRGWNCYYANLYHAITTNPCKKVVYPKWLLNIRNLLLINKVVFEN